MHEKNSVPLDTTDIKILEILQEDCKKRIADIAKEVGRGISSVHARIKALEANGVINAYRCVINPTAVKRSTLAFILIRVRYRAPGTDEVLSQRDLCKELAKHPYVQEVHVLSGEFDVILKVRTGNVEEINSFIVDFLREIPAVERTHTMFTMDTYLETSEIRDLQNRSQEFH
ncbi:MAG: Lrp/AsnC family transcriptional regulator [Candidatus Thorarchaeota archaeon]